MGRGEVDSIACDSASGCSSGYARGRLETPSFRGGSSRATVAKAGGLATDARPAILMGPGERRARKLKFGIRKSQMREHENSERRVQNAGRSGLAQNTKTRRMRIRIRRDQGGREPSREAAQSRARRPPQAGLEI